MTQPTLPPVDSDGESPTTPFNPTLHEELIAAGYSYERRQSTYVEQHVQDWDEYASPDRTKKILVGTDGSSKNFGDAFNSTLHEELITKGYRYTRCDCDGWPEDDWDEYVSPDGVPSQMIWVSSDGSVETFEEGEWDDERLSTSSQ